MKPNTVKLIIYIIVTVIIVSCTLFVLSDLGLAEEQLDKLYIMSKSLNGRIRPGKKYHAVVTFEYGIPLTPTGRWSRDHQWVEIETAENDLVWCNVNYLTERREVIHVYTLNDQKIAIRKSPGYGKVTGYAKKEQVLEITQVVMGYGRCSKGWVDLSYFIEDCE